MPRGCLGSGTTALERNRLIGRGITGSGFQPAMVRAHSRACMVLVINGNNRRSSTAAANSPCCSKAVRIGGFHLGDDEHTARMATRRGRQAPRSRQPA